MTDTITLKYPLADNGETIDRITLRRPKVRDMLTSASDELSDAEKEVWLFASLSGLTLALIEDMDVADYQQLQKVYAGFLD